MNELWILPERFNKHHLGYLHAFSIYDVISVYWFYKPGLFIHTIEG